MGCVVTCGALACLGASASAAAIFDYTVGIDDGINHPVSAGTVSLGGLDSTKNTRVIVTAPGGAGLLDTTAVSGSQYFSSGTLNGLAVGSTISVRQPAASVSPTETYVVPSPTLTLTNGATTVTGTVPAGLIGGVEPDERCGNGAPPFTVPAGAFAVPVAKTLPGDMVVLSVYSLSGDRTSLYSHSPGETPCVEISADPYVNPPPGGTPNANPYRLVVDHLVESISPSVRVVLRRGGTTIIDDFEDATDFNRPTNTLPLPGDIVDIYRPKTAPTPTFSVTIPPVAASFDPAADLVAINAPASGLVAVGDCRAYECVSENARYLRGTPAGRTLLDFRLGQGLNLPLDLRSDDVLSGEYFNPDFTLDYTFGVAPGDLVAPTQSFKLPSKLKISALVKALKKGLKIKLTSSEAGTAKLTLGKLATAKGNVKAGTTTLKLKFSKSGKTQIKKLAAKGRRAKSKSVSLTSVVTDASGNASTLTKRTKIKP
jgi:hypothetical protein